MEDFGNGGLREWRISGMEDFGNGGILEWRISGMEEFWTGGFREWGVSGMKEWRNCRMKESNVEDERGNYEVLLCQDRAHMLYRILLIRTAPSVYWGIN